MSRVVCSGCGLRDCGGRCYSETRIPHDGWGLESEESISAWLERAAPIARKLNEEARKDKR